MLLNYYEESLIKNTKLPSEWQSQLALDELSSFLQFNWEQRSVFYDDGQVTSRQQFIEFVGQRGIKTKNYIGTVVFKGQQLNIFPKVFRTEKDDNDRDDLDTNHLMKNLVQWIEYCGKIDYPYMSITSELDDSTNLRELFVILYIRYVKNALDRGLFYRYEEHVEDTSLIKGRIDFRDYFIKKYPNGRVDKFKCEYSNFEHDNVLNRIIKYTCKSLINEVSGKNQKVIRHILMKLADVSDVKCSPYDCDKVRLSKLQGHYQIILSMSKMLLLNKTSTYNVDNAESFCFLFPTEVLFEGFIGGFIQSALGSDAKVRLQASDESLFSDVQYLGESLGKAFIMKHDILVEHKEKGVFILDTKYKMINRFAGSDNVKQRVNQEANSTDIYQVLAYARTRNLQDVYLLYPLFRFEDIEPGNPFGINEVKDSQGNAINVHIVRLPFVFEDDIENTKLKLREVITNIIT
ncbi:MAG: hypothetical protein R3Y32_04575 [Bacillota bacterium]